MPQATTPSKKETGFPEWLNFDYFREKGRAHIGQLSGNLWTDHNPHDPGITILEVLCYALTDLGYRNQFDASALFARKPGTLNELDDNFFSPAEILSVNPLTLVDFKKLMLEVPGVRNAWLKPVTMEPLEQNPKMAPLSKQEQAIYIHKNGANLTFEPKDDELFIKGLYDVFVDLEDFTPPNEQTPKQLAAADAVLTTVWETLQAHRPLCEDFKSITVIQPEKVWFCMEVDLTPGADPEGVFVELFNAIQNFLTPSIQFYTLQEMLDKQIPIDKIFEGRPLLKDSQEEPLSNGFIDETELPLLDPKNTLHISDIYKLILTQLPGNGVRAIRSLKFFSDSSPTGNEWSIFLDPLKSPRLLIDQCQIFYSKGQLPIAFDTAVARPKLNLRLANFHKMRRDRYALGWSITQGKYYDFADYTSIQREFPKIYSINENQLPIVPSRISDQEREQILLRRRQALQLKGYLTFFDQMLANYLAQLANVRKLLAVRPSEAPRSTYFNSELSNMPDSDLILERTQLQNGKFASGFHLFHGRPLMTLMLAPEQTKYTFSEMKGEFASDDLRNSAVYFFRKGFENGTVLLEIINRQLTEDPNIPPCENYYFTFRLPGSKAILRSNDLYESEEAAREVAELVRFLGILEQCYKPKDNAKGFKSSIIYNPLNYTAFLDYITETPERFYDRRGKFLDHLLARFAEQFTEYTLLMFALDGKAKSQEDVIADKARFLSRYPDISRNRGRAFNYTLPPVWNTENVSGFEQRVAGFMGLDNWKRRTLNHLKTTISENQPLTRWSINGLPLFQTKQAITDVNYLKQLWNTGLVKSVDCVAESMYGFELIDPDNGCQVTYLPQCATRKERDAVTSFWQGYFNGSPVSAIACNDRTSIQIKNVEGLVFLKGVERFHRQKHAKRAFFLAIQLAMEAKHYVDLTDGEGHFFALHDATGDLVATCPIRFDTDLERDQAKEKFIQFIQSNWPRYSVEETDGYLDWRLHSSGGNLLFVSVLRHKIHDQTGVFETVWQALKWARKSVNWQVIRHENGSYGLSLAKPGTSRQDIQPVGKPFNKLEIGRVSTVFATEQEAGNALQLLLATLSAPTSIEHALVVTADKQVSFQCILPGEAEPILKSREVYQTKTEAALAYERFLVKASTPQQYQINSDGYLLVDFGNGENAISLNPFPTKAADQIIAQIAAQIKTQYPLLSVLVPQPNEYFQQVAIDSPKQGVTHLLQGKKRYKSALAAYQKLPKLLALLQEKALVTVNPPNGDAWELRLMDGEKVFAEADQEYIKMPEWILPSLTDTASGVVGDSHRYRIGFLDCACKLQYLLSEEDSTFDTPMQAITAGLQALQHLKEKCGNPSGVKKTIGTTEATSLVVKNGLLQLITCSSKQVLASWLPESLAIPDYIVQSSAFNFLHNTVQIEAVQLHTIPIQADYTPEELAMMNGKNCLADRFRLRDEDAVIARFCDTFDESEKRDLAVAAFLSYWKKADKSFPAINFASIVKDKLKTLQNECKPCNAESTVKPYSFYFRFECECQNYTWIGVEHYSDESLAHQQIADTTLVALMGLLADPDAFVVKDISGNETLFELQVYDYKKIGLRPKLVLDSKFETSLEARKASKSIQDCLAAYPYYLNAEGKLCFRLFNRDKKRVEWQSTRCYDSLQDAKNAFQEFLRLLEYPANILRTTKPFGLLLGEVMLEAYNQYIPNENEYPGCGENVRCETKVWESGVEEQLLSRVFAPDGVILADTEDCGYSFRVVGSTYRLARHPHQYRSAAERSRAIKAVQALYSCGQAPRSNMIKGKITPAVVNTEEKNCALIVPLLPGFIAFHLKPVDERDIDVFWQMPLNEPNLLTTDNAWDQLMPWAEYPDFFLQKLNQDGSLSLTLVDEDSKVLAYAYLGDRYKLTLEEVEKIIRTTVLQAREHPVKVVRATRSGEMNTCVYKIYSRHWQPSVVAEPYDITGAYIWESIVPKSDNPESYFKRCYQGWLSNASQKGDGYQNTREPECGDFSFDAVDSSQIIAYYPGSFCTKQAAETGIQRMLELVDREGFHLLENILLRPIHPDKSGIDQDKLDEVLLKLPKELSDLWSPAFRASKGLANGQFNSCFNKKLPGSDPYSAQVTIVLPYWSRRFQNARFRDFFENTLRRELPAHCRLRTIWATPQDMYNFEKNYKNWLSGMATGDAEAYKQPLVAHLNSVASYYKLILDDPGAFLNTATLS